MLKNTSRWVGLMVVLALVSPTLQAGENPGEVVSRFQDAYRSGSADAMLALYTPTVEGQLAWMGDQLAGIVASIGSTGMAVAAIFGIVLDNLVPGTPEERGLGPSAPEGGDIGVGED